jgi:hypothetical protein
MSEDDVVSIRALCATQPCTTCRAVPRPPAIVEMCIPGAPTRWLCWDCLHRLFERKVP